MKITQEQSKGLKQTFTVVIPKKDIDSKVSDKLDEISKQVSIPGFRKGKAPQSYLRQKYGASLMGEVLEDVVRESAENIIKDKELKPAMQPKIEIGSFAEGSDLEFTVKVETLPEVKVSDLSKISLEKETAEVSEVDIDNAIDKISVNVKDSEEIQENRKSKKGDIAVIDFVGKVDGVAFSGGKGEDYHLELGSGMFIPGFEEQLVGFNAGEKVVVKVKFPDDYHSNDLKGKDAEFDVEIKSLRAIKKPEINDEFAKKFGKETIVELRDLIRSEIGKEYDVLSKAVLKRKLLDSLAESHSFELPEGMVDMEFDAIWRQVEDAKKHNTLDDGDKDKSEDDLKAEYRHIAARRVKLGIVLAEIGRINNIVVEPTDVNRALIEEAGRYPGQEAMVIEFYKNNPQMLENLKAPIYENKVVDFIISKADIKDKKVSLEDLHKAARGDDEEGKDRIKTSKSSSSAKKGSAPSEPAKKKTAAKEKK